MRKKPYTHICINPECESEFTTFKANRLYCYTCRPKNYYKLKGKAKKQAKIVQPIKFNDIKTKNKSKLKNTMEFYK